MKNFFKFIPPDTKRNFSIKKSKISKEALYNKDTKISKDLNKNLEIIKELTHYSLCSDIKIREFQTVINNQSYSSFIIFYDGLTDSNLIDGYILKPMMANLNSKENDLKKMILENILLQNQLDTTQIFADVISGILSGNCVIFIDSLDIAIICDTKKLPQRSISKSENEMSTRGPSEAFVEGLRPNTGLIRKFVKDENLIFEDIEIGRRGKTTCSIAYISNITNDSLIEEVKKRISSIDVDYLIDVGQLEQFIEDKTYIVSPLILSTERPDKVASHLFEGRIAILMSGSPNALIVPAVFTDFMHATEDSYVRFPYSALLRFFRIPALFLSIFLPGLYLAIALFHQEMIPSDLLFSIAATREKVPFPLLVELLIMEISFEIIREASLRTPAPIGPTLGIVGTLILGQAIVSANVVSPILIIIIALTGISSFAVANYSLNYTFRILRFVYIFLGAFAGFLGISIGAFMHICMLSSANSFGVPYLSPWIPNTKDFLRNDLITRPIWKQELRPSFLKTKDKRRQPKFSKKWTGGN